MCTSFMKQCRVRQMSDMQHGVLFILKNWGSVDVLCLGQSL